MLTTMTADGSPLAVTVLAENDPPALSAAAEVAAYRIVVEAPTNVVRHAQAYSVVVELAPRDGHLVVSIRDDGRSGEPWTPGVGIASMRERSLQVGGTLQISATTGGGWVEARMPLGPRQVRA